MRCPDYSQQSEFLDFVSLDFRVFSFKDKSGMLLTNFLRLKVSSKKKTPAFLRRSTNDFKKRSKKVDTAVRERQLALS